MLSLIVLSSCQKDPSFFNIKNLNNNEIMVFGHAGMGIGFKYPINSYRSLEACLRLGADGTETDVQLTKDSVLVLFHDDNLEHSTSKNGVVNEMNWSELQNCVYASPYATNLKLQKADDIIKQFNNNKRIFTFDCKLYKRADVNYQAFIQSYANALISLIQKNNIKDYAFIESNDVSFLTLLKAIDPELNLFIYPENFEKGIEIADNLNLFGITISNHDITESQISFAHSHGRRVTVWNVATIDQNIDAITKSPDYIQSDKIIHLLKVFDKYKNQGWKDFEW